MIFDILNNRPALDSVVYNLFIVCEICTNMKFKPTKSTHLENTRKIEFSELFTFP